MAQEFCPQCGEPRTGYLRYCRKCGFDFGAPQASNVGAESSSPTPTTASGGTPLPGADRRAGERESPAHIAYTNPPFAQSVEPQPKPRSDQRKDFLGCLSALGGLALLLIGWNNPSLAWLVLVGLVVGLGGLIYSPTVMELGEANARVEAKKKSAKADDERAKAENELRVATQSWARPFLVRSYGSDKEGLTKAEHEANILGRHGYDIAGQSGAGSHINVGRTVTGAALTGGLSLLFGGSRTKGSVQITFTKRG